MSKKHDRGRLDWLAELTGALTPAAAAAYAAAQLAPGYGWSPFLAVLVAGGGTFAAAFTAMRVIPAEAHHLVLPDFEPVVVIDDILLLDEPYVDELLLDQPLVDAATEALAELLLEDALPVPTPDSRVVQLFADGRMPTAGQLRHRIDRHLAEGARPDTPGVASDKLSEALAELRRSLRQA